MGSESQIFLLVLVVAIPSLWMMLKYHFTAVILYLMYVAGSTTILKENILDTRGINGQDLVILCWGFILLSYYAIQRYHITKAQRRSPDYGKIFIVVWFPYVVSVIDLALRPPDNITVIELIATAKNYIIPAIIFTLAFYLPVVTYRELRITFWLMITITAIFCFQAVVISWDISKPLNIIQFLSSSERFTQTLETTGVDYMVLGWGGAPLPIIIPICSALTISYIFLKEEKNIFIKLAMLLMVVGLLIGEIRIFSRASIGLYLWIICVAWAISNTKFKITSALSILIPTFLFLFIAFPLVLNTLHSSQYGFSLYSDESTSGRLYYNWPINFDLFFSSPLFGVGQWQGFGIAPHNQYLYWLSRLGGLGFLIYFGCYIGIAKAFYKVYKISPERSYMKILSLAFFIYMTGQAAIMFLYHDTFNYIWLNFAMLTLGLTINNLRNLPERFQIKSSLSV